MNQATHTKGKWYAEPANPYPDEESGERPTYQWAVRTEYDMPDKSGCVGVQVCEISSWNTGSEEADARLIAAAPELLEALIEARRLLEQYESDATGETFNSPKLNAAIAKATGAE